MAHHLADQYGTDLMDFWRLEISANRVWCKKRTYYTNALISRFTESLNYILTKST